MLLSPILLSILQHVLTCISFVVSISIWMYLDTSKVLSALGKPAFSSPLIYIQSGMRCFKIWEPHSSWRRALFRSFGRSCKLTPCRFHQSRSLVNLSIRIAGVNTCWGSDLILSVHEYARYGVAFSTVWLQTLPGPHHHLNPCCRIILQILYNLFRPCNWIYIFVCWDPHVRRKRFFIVDYLWLEVRYCPPSAQWLIDRLQRANRFQNFVCR